jgi:hypothetical protein
MNQERATMKGRRNERRTRRVVVACISAFNLGCYTAVPITSDAARVGTRITLELTDAGTVDMASQVGPRIHTLVGDVNVVTDSSVVLSMRSAVDVRGVESLWQGEQVTVRRSDIGSVGERRLSSGKTAAFSVILVAGAFLVARAFGLVGGGEDHRGDIPVTQ